MVNKQEIEKAISYWSEFKAEIKDLRKQNSKVDWDEQEKAVDLAIEALGKQVPKKPIENFYDEDDGYWYDEGYTYQCPLCEESGVGRYSKEICEWVYQMTHCEKCGQAIDWRNVVRKIQNIGRC
jgi:hypothetical protein